MRIGVLYVALSIIIIVGLTGCLGSRRSELPTSETGFPIGAVRIYDGVTIQFGMTRSEVGEVVQRLDIRTGEVIEEESTWFQVIYDNSIIIHYLEEKVVLIGFVTEEWAIAYGIYVGDDIQSVLENSAFNIYNHNDDMVELADDLQNPEFLISLTYDRDGEITSIVLVKLF